MEEAKTNDGKTDRERITAALVEKYGAGKCKLFPVPDGTFIGVRKPSRGEYKRYMGRLMNDKDDKDAAMYEFSMSCVVYPESEDNPDKGFAKTAFDEYGGLPLSISKGLMQLCGADVEGETLKV